MQSHNTSVREIGQLLDQLLSSDNRTLGESLKAWKAAFPVQDRFRVSCSALMLLEDSRALSLAQRITAWFLISQAWPVELAPTNPFTCCLIRTAASHTAHPAERNLALQLLDELDPLPLASSAQRLVQPQQQQLEPKFPFASPLRSSLVQLQLQTPLQYVLSRRTPFLDAGPPDAAALEQQYSQGLPGSALPQGPLMHALLNQGGPTLTVPPALQPQQCSAMVGEGTPSLSPQPQQQQPQQHPQKQGDTLSTFPHIHAPLAAHDAQGTKVPPTDASTALSTAIQQLILDAVGASRACSTASTARSCTNDQPPSHPPAPAHFPNLLLTSTPARTHPSAVSRGSSTTLLGPPAGPQELVTELPLHHLQLQQQQQQHHHQPSQQQEHAPLHPHQPPTVSLTHTPLQPLQQTPSSHPNHTSMQPLQHPNPRSYPPDPHIPPTPPSTSPNPYTTKLYQVPTSSDPSGSTQLDPLINHHHASRSFNQTTHLLPSTSSLHATSHPSQDPCLLPPPPLLCRPHPGILPIQQGECEWMGPGVVMHTGPVWDSSGGSEEEVEGVVRELLARALRGPLLPAQQQQILSALEADPKLVHHLGVAPRHLPALVEHTPVIAYELLLRLMRGPRTEAFLSVLASTCMSLHSMEVVNKLTSTVDIPTEFIHVYISNCITSCESTQDKYVQNRLVRLVCVFLHSLIRNRIVNIADLLHEVQTFCINFSRIREAAKLFRLLKAEQGEPGA